MEYTTFVIGIFAVLFGLYTLVIRLMTPKKLGKLEAMKEKFGEKMGTLIHTISYTLVPIIVGMVFIVNGMNGKALF